MSGLNDYCMVIDLKRCVGCGACATMCKQENGTPPGVTRAKVVKKEIGTFPNVRRLSLPMLCMHCEEPACVDACPSGATAKDAENGIVTVDKDVCIGCRACMTACPYGARYFRKTEEGYFGSTLTPFEEIKYKDMPKGTVDKCTFCVETKLKNGQKPACVETCITTARHFGTRAELAELIRRRKGYRLREELGTGPSVYYLD
jgi:molybdopterin-containing oxidoreductase family iron-sulfur binding subunit